MGALPSEAAYHDVPDRAPHRLAFDERLASEAARAVVTEATSRCACSTSIAWARPRAGTAYR